MAIKNFAITLAGRILVSLVSSIVMTHNLLGLSRARLSVGRGRR